jgi:hypothetical protein
VAEQVSPFVDQVQVLIPVFYGGVLTVMDDFASDEVVGTLGVIVAALALAWVLATAVGFWARRGRSGLVAYLLQAWWGAHLFRGWYVDNLEFALGRPIFLAARARVKPDVVADPRGALAPEAFEALERYFALGRDDHPAVDDAPAAPGTSVSCGPARRSPPSRRRSA